MSTDMTRRAVLARTPAAIAAVAVLPAPASPAIAATSPDDPLIELEQRWHAARKAETSAKARVEAIEATLPAWYFEGGVPLPDDKQLASNLFYACGLGSGGYLTIEDIRAFNLHTESIVADWRYRDQDDPEREKNRQSWLRRSREGQKRIAYYKAREAERDAGYEASGLNARHDDYLRCSEVVNEIEVSIIGTPATSMAGIAVKLRLYHHRAKRAHKVPVETDQDFDFQYKPAVSALRDAERLAQGAS